MGCKSLRLGLLDLGLARLLTLLPGLSLGLLNLAVGACADGRKLSLQRRHSLLTGALLCWASTSAGPVQTLSLGQELGEEVALASDLGELVGGLLQLGALLLDDLRSLVHLEACGCLTLGAVRLPLAKLGRQAARECE